MDNILVRQMLDVIENDYANVVTLRALSTTIGRQAAYLGRLFRQEVGSNVREHLTKVRLDHAAVFIREGMKIEAVALSVGYRSKKNFYQQFRKRYGTTPLAYRDGAEDSMARERATDGRANSPEQMETVSDRYRCGPLNGSPQAPHDAEPVLGPLTTIVRASNKAWRLAVRAQQIMAENFNRLRIGVLVTDDEGKYVAANPAALAITAYSASELHVLSPSGLFVNTPLMDVRCVWHLLFLRHRRSDQAMNATLRTKDGESVGVRLVTLRNFLWGRGEMSNILEDAG